MNPHENTVNGNFKIRYGKYAGKFLKDIPDDYLKWLYNAGIDCQHGRSKIKLHIQHRFNMPKTTYEIKELNSERDYIVEAYNLNEAYRLCGKVHTKQVGPRESEFSLVRTINSTCSEIPNGSTI